MTAPDMDCEWKRRHFGWFGEPWPSGICYTDDGAVDEAMRLPTPVGEKCLDCDEQIVDGDRGKAMPLTDGHTRIVYMHVECMFMEVVGPLQHVRGRCTGVGQCHDDTELTRRQEALAVWDHVQKHGVG